MRIRLLVLAVCLAAGMLLASATASRSEPGANAVTVWNANAGEAVIAACLLGGFAPQEARMYAMMHVAVHDALNGIDRRSRPYAVSLGATPGTSPDAAVAAAARDVLVSVLGSFSFFLPAACIEWRDRERGGGLRGRARGHPEWAGEVSGCRFGTGGCRSDPGLAFRGRLRHAAD